MRLWLTVKNGKHLPALATQWIRQPPAPRRRQSLEAMARALTTMSKQYGIPLTTAKA